MEIYLPVASILLVAWVAARKFHSIINPPGLHALSYLMALAFYGGFQMLVNYSELHFIQLEDPTRVATAYALSALSFAVAWIGFRERVRYLSTDSSVPRILDLQNLRSWMLAESAVLSLVLIVLFLYLGAPLADMIRGSLDILELNARLAELPLGLLAIKLVVALVLALQFAVVAVYRHHYPALRRWLIPLFLLIVLVNVWQAKRQLFLITVVFLLLMFVSDSKDTKKLRTMFGLAVLAALAWMLFVAVQYVRVSASSREELFLSEMFVAVVWPLINLDYVIAAIPPAYDLQALLSNIVPHRYLGHSVEGIRDFLFEPTASISYVQYAYMDFGYWGIAGVSLLFGLLTRALSSMSSYNAVVRLQIRLLVLWVCVSSAMYSHPISLNFFLLPAALLWIISRTAGLRIYVRGASPAAAQPTNAG
jgi:oligosaccharide repeat unit polymerase